VLSNTELVVMACVVAFDYFKPSWKQDKRAACRYWRTGQPDNTRRVT